MAIVAIKECVTQMNDRSLLGRVVVDRRNGPNIKQKVRTTGNIFICCQRIFLTEESYLAHRKTASCYDRQKFNDYDVTCNEKSIPAKSPTENSEAVESRHRRPVNRFMIAPKKTQFKQKHFNRPNSPQDNRPSRFVCELCNYHTMYNCQLKHHSRIAHNNPYECKLCPRSYASEAGLKIHSALEHKIHGRFHKFQRNLNHAVVSSANVVTRSKVKQTKRGKRFDMRNHKTVDLKKPILIREDSLNKNLSSSPKSQTNSQNHTSPLKQNNSMSSSQKVSNSINPDDLSATNLSTYLKKIEAEKTKDDSQHFFNHTWNGLNSNSNLECFALAAYIRSYTNSIKSDSELFNAFVTLREKMNLFGNTSSQIVSKNSISSLMNLDSMKGHFSSPESSSSDSNSTLNTSSSSTDSEDIELDIIKEEFKTSESETKAKSLVACSLCSYMACDREILTRHLKNAHNPDAFFKCYFCSCRYESLNKMIKHCNRHHSKQLDRKNKKESVDLNTSGRSKSQTNGDLVTCETLLKSPNFELQLMGRLPSFDVK